MNILKIPNQIIKQTLQPLNLSNVDAIALHHMAHPTADVKTVEQWHTSPDKKDSSKPWRAIGYNYWIAFDGTIYEGRGLNLGAGVANQNSHVISIGCQGDYQTQPFTMPATQRIALYELCQWLLTKVPTVKTIAGHGAFMSTSCPGKYFPISDFKIEKVRAYNAITPPVQPTQSLPYKVVTVYPSALRVAIVDSEIKPYNSYASGGYFGLHPDKSTYPEGLLVDNAVDINDRGVRGNATGTLFIKKNGSAVITPAEELRKHNIYNDCKTAISGMSILPYRQTEEGFVGQFSDVARLAPRVMLGITNEGRILICCHKNITAKDGGELMKSLGCVSAITLDGGGSTCMRVAGTDYMTSTRRINNVLWW